MVLEEGQEPYNPTTKDGYDELNHFFEDVNYKVESIEVKEPQ